MTMPRNYEEYRQKDENQQNPIESSNINTTRGAARTDTSTTPEPEEDMESFAGGDSVDHQAERAPENFMNELRDQIVSDGSFSERKYEIYQIFDKIMQEQIRQIREVKQNNDGEFNLPQKSLYLNRIFSKYLNLNKDSYPNYLQHYCKEYSKYGLNIINLAGVVDAQLLPVLMNNLIRINERIYKEEKVTVCNKENLVQRCYSLENKRFNLIESLVMNPSKDSFKIYKDIPKFGNYYKNIASWLQGDKKKGILALSAYNSQYKFLKICVKLIEKNAAEKSGYTFEPSKDLFYLAAKNELGNSQEEVIKTLEQIEELFKIANQEEKLALGNQKAMDIAIEHNQFITARYLINNKNVEIDNPIYDKETICNEAERQEADLQLGYNGVDQIIKSQILDTEPSVHTGSMNSMSSYGSLEDYSASYAGNSNERGSVSTIDYDEICSPEVIAAKRAKSSTDTNKSGVKRYIDENNNTSSGAQASASISSASENSQNKVQTNESTGTESRGVTKAPKWDYSTSFEIFKKNLSFGFVAELMKKQTDANSQEQGQSQNLEENQYSLNHESENSQIKPMGENAENNDLPWEDNGE